MINPHGGSEEIYFEFDIESEVYFSCSLQWQNRLHVFGGWNKKQQVSIVNGHRLERKGTLNFNFKYGGCTVLNQSIIVLCFDDDEKKVCRQSYNPLESFTKLPKSHYNHAFTRIASYNGTKKKIKQIVFFRYIPRTWWSK